MNEVHRKKRTSILCVEPFSVLQEFVYRAGDGRHPESVREFTERIKDKWPEARVVNSSDALAADELEGTAVNHALVGNVYAIAGLHDWTCLVNHSGQQESNGPVDPGDFTHLFKSD